MAEMAENIAPVSPGGLVRRWPESRSSNPIAYRRRWTVTAFEVYPQPAQLDLPAAVVFK